MHEFVFILLFITVVYLQCYAGLKCKAGNIVHSYDRWVFRADEQKVEECNTTAEYCAAVTCTRAGRLGFSRITWWCANFKRTSFECAELFRQGFEENAPRQKGLMCECHYGEKGQDMGNEQFTLLPIPNGLMCKLGQFDVNGIGSLLEGKCLHNDHYCFMARCNKGNEYFKTEWGCVGDPHLVSINQQIGETVKAVVACEAMFGQKDVAFSNENFTIDMLDVETSTTTTTTTTRQLEVITKPTTTTTSTTTTTTTTTTEPTIEESTNSTNGGSVGQP
ncbi:hypothetical protein niasHT_011987 [Heterodera trifolii]|uniref:Uncharacterized protein n=1 Tax=Heterodera trifolii TaxID=157864 RepID=A0ABD2L1T5_9BILA